jgi:nucleotide-binding universal stress UspA family protein
MKRILLAVRDDLDTKWAVDFVIRLHQREPIVVHLLSVQAPWDGHVRMFFSEAQIRRFHEEDGEKQLEPVREALDRAGVQYTPHVAVGFGAETIAKFAREYHCSQIVMGPARQGPLSQLILGSITRQVEHLMQVSGQQCEVL